MPLYHLKAVSSSHAWYYLYDNYYLVQDTTLSSYYIADVSSIPQKCRNYNATYEQVQGNEGCLYPLEIAKNIVEITYFNNRWLRVRTVDGAYRLATVVKYEGHFRLHLVCPLPHAHFYLKGNLVIEFDTTSQDIRFYSYTTKGGLLYMTVLPWQLRMSHLANYLWELVRKFRDGEKPTITSLLLTTVAHLVPLNVNRLAVIGETNFQQAIDTVGSLIMLYWIAHANLLTINWQTNQTLWPDYLLGGINFRDASLNYQINNNQLNLINRERVYAIDNDSWTISPIEVENQRSENFNLATLAQMEIAVNLWSSLATKAVDLGGMKITNYDLSSSGSGSKLDGWSFRVIQGVHKDSFIIVEYAMSYSAGSNKLFIYPKTIQARDKILSFKVNNSYNMAVECILSYLVFDSPPAAISTASSTYWQLAYTKLIRHLLINVEQFYRLYCFEQHAVLVQSAMRGTTDNLMAVINWTTNELNIRQLDSGCMYQMRLLNMTPSGLLTYGGIRQPQIKNSVYWQGQFRLDFYHQLHPLEQPRIKERGIAAFSALSSIGLPPELGEYITSLAI